MEQQRNQKPVQEHQELEEVQQGPFPVEQLQGNGFRFNLLPRAFFRRCSDF
ncbi:hypothetical protein TorRG33x02_348440 [Trema orientale]|uniref:Uncharacterized protein n=1 Tax=Trema orientale TaxID=63057 RepID=A0A2P5AJY2_TREOI|nr:hypothetical protein TorRG33x02_348440 [Trema orientale]